MRFAKAGAKKQSQSQKLKVVSVDVVAVVASCGRASKSATQYGMCARKVPVCRCASARLCLSTWVSRCGCLCLGVFVTCAFAVVFECHNCNC